MQNFGKNNHNPDIYWIRVQISAPSENEDVLLKKESTVFQTYHDPVKLTSTKKLNYKFFSLVFYFYFRR